MLERQIERRLVELVKKNGGLCLKLIGYKGIPDRIILTKSGKVMFVELKAPGKKPRPEQVAWQELLKRKNFDARVIDNYEDVDKLRDFLEH